MHARSEIPLEMLNIGLIRIGRLRMPEIVTMQGMVGSLLVKVASSLPSSSWRNR